MANCPFFISHKTHPLDDDDNNNNNNNNRKMIAICFEISIKHINTRCGQYVVVLNVKPVDEKFNPRNLTF
jgi:hypothetical protein